MRWKWIAGTAIIAVALFLFSTYDDRRPDDPETMPRERELSMKRTIMKRDAESTEQLFKAACAADVRRVFAQAKSAADVKHRLQQMIDHNRHFVYAVWQPSGDPETGPHEESVRIGSLPDDADETLRSRIDAASVPTEPGTTRISGTIRSGKRAYIVIHATSPNARLGSITAVARQELSDRVMKEQRKNLRIVPYPSDKRFNIESVDADTLRDKKVRHPEHNEGTSHYLADHVVVKFRNEPKAEQLAQIRKDIGCRRVRRLGYTYVFESERLNAKQMMDYFRDRWNPEYVEPHYIYLTNGVKRTNALPHDMKRTSLIDSLKRINGRARSTDTEESVPAPNDELFAAYQWNLPNIATLRGWQLSKGSEAVKVAVIDTGVDLDHPDLVGRLAEGINFVDENSPPEDDVGHGTHVAGIIAATVDNVEGVAGISWYNQVIPVKVLDHTGAGSTYDVARGIIWATDAGASVINLSLGNYVDAEFLHDAVRYAYDRDVVLIAATGNDSTEEPGYPAAYPEVLAVSATDRFNRRSVFSNFGDYLDVVAPGETIASTYYQDQYAALSGTSMASPHAAALAAMIRSLNPDLTNEEVMDIMRKSAVDLGPPGKDPYYGHGLIDVRSALEYALQPEGFSETPKTTWEDVLDRLRRLFTR